MKNLKKLFRFICYQFCCALAIVLICTLISSILTYRTLRKDLEIWTIDSNERLLNQYANYIYSTLSVGAEETYLQLLNEVSNNPVFNYYSYTLNESNLIDTLQVKTYLGSIKSSSPIIKSVGIYYPANSLLITNDRIRYTKYYHYRQREIEPYEMTLTGIPSGLDNQFYVYTDIDTVHVVRKISSGNLIKAGVFIEYKAEELRKILYAAVPYDEGNVLILDSSGNILLDLLCQNAIENLSDDLIISRVGSGSGYFTAEIEDRMSLISYQTDLRNSWTYVVIVPLDTMTDPVSFILSNLLLSSGITVLFGLILAIILAVSQTRSIRPIVALCDESDFQASKDAYGAIHGTLSRLIAQVEDNDSRLEKIMPHLREDFILWLLAELPDDKAVIDDKILLTQVEFPHPSFCVIAVQSDADEVQSDFALAEVRFVMQKSLNTPYSLCGLCKKDHHILALINFSCTYDMLIKICGILSAQSHGQPDAVHHYYSLGPMISDLSQVSGTVCETVNHLRYRFLYPDKHLFLHADFTGLEQKHYRQRDQLGQYSEFLRNHDAAKAEVVLRKIINSLRHEGCSLRSIHFLMLELVAEVETLTGYQPAMQQELIRLVSEARDIDQFIDELSDIVSSEMDAATKKPTQSSEDLIELAIAHVDASLRDSQLSLTTVSGMLGVSPNYLSRVFHEVKNTTFINYVSTAKIKLGCKMLLESKKTLREISEELNYASPQYFISRFKNQFGVTPSVYRHKNTSDNAHT